MTDIPKRPPREGEGHPGYHLQWVYYEHAVAQVAVEALRNLVSVERPDASWLTFLPKIFAGCAALRQIEASGWKEDKP